MAVITNERLAAVASDLQRLVSQVNYDQFDFYSIKAALLQYLQLNYPDDFNDYVENSVIVALIEEIAYLGEQLAYRQDMIANELLPSVSQNREIVLDQFRIIAYESARPNSATGVASLVMQYAADGVTPLTDTDYIAGLPRWIFNPYISSSSIGSLNVNGVYSTFLPNHIKVPLTLGTETLAYELTSTSYDNGYALQPIENSTLGLVFDGTNWTVIIQQGTTITESVVQDTTEADLTLTTSKPSCDQTVPYVSVNGLPWTYVPSLYLNSINVTNAFTTRHDSTDTVSVIFGDGLKTAVPRGNISYIYRICDGIKGNIQSTAMNGTSVNVVIANPVSGNRLENITLNLIGKTSISGGADQEALDTIKRHGPYSYATQGRQVSGIDYATAVLDVEGVQLAKAINRTYVGHDATGTYSAILSVSEDAVSGTATSFDTNTSFNGVNLGIDTITVIDPVDISNLHPVESVSETGGVWTVNTVTGMPASWSGNYMWKHWTANSVGSIKFPVTSYATGTVTCNGFIADHVVPLNKIVIHDYVNGNWYYADATTDITYDTVTPAATIAFRDGNGTLQSAVTLTGAFVYVDYTYNTDIATLLTIPASPAPSASGDFFYYDTDTINVGDTIWENVSGDGYVVLDIIRADQVVSGTTYDKIFVGRNGRTSSPSTLVAGADFHRTTYLRQTQALINPSKSNIIDLYCVQADANGYAYADPSNTLSLSAIELSLNGTQVETDMVLAHWGKLKKLKIDMIIYLKSGVASSTEVLSRIQNSVYEYFKLNKPEDWSYQTFTFGDTMFTSPLIQYLHDNYPEIDHIDHSAFDAVDKTTTYDEIITVDANYAGLTLG